MTNSSPAPLFRWQALEATRSRLEGNVIVKDVGWLRNGGYLLPLVALPFIVSTLFWSYPRLQLASGWLTTTEGLVQVHALRAGILESLPVVEGDHVTADKVVAVVRLEQVQPTGGTPEVELLAFVAVQQQRLDQQIELRSERYAKETAHRRELLSDLQKERDEIEIQLKRQAAIMESAWRDVEAAEKLVAKGFATGREVRNRRESWAQRGREEASLRQQKAAIEGRITSAQADLDQLPLDLEGDLARLESSRAELSQRRAQIEGQRRYALVAPIAGRIANLNMRKGYSVDPQRPIMAIVPDGADLEAELFVPSSASAFVKPGQNVRLLYDAFPHQRFGSGEGRVTRVSQSTILPADAPAPLGINEPVYVVRISLSNPTVTAFGERVSLKPGMTLKANVLLEQRSIFEWIFEPLYAVRGRT